MTLSPVSLAQTEGVVLGFYKGLVPSMAKSSLSSAVTFSVYGVAMRLLDSHNMHNIT